MPSTDDPSGSSRKQQRDAAREQRRAAEAADRASAVRRTRIFQLGGALAVAIVVVVVIVIATSGGGGSKDKGIQTGTAARATVARASSLLTGVPQSGITLGKATAPVTMTYYGDLECPVCQDFTLNTLPQVITNDVRTGRMKIQYRSLETATQDPTTFQTQQVAALAAGRQNHMWDYVELFYHEQGAEGTGYVTESYLRRLASQVPRLALPTWQADRNDAAFVRQVDSDRKSAIALGVSATPTLILRGPRGERGVAGAASYAEVQKLLTSVA